MHKPRSRQKGTALFLVLGTVFMVIALANVLLTIINSQQRLTHHQISRIQAYYASMAGINYAYNRLTLQDPAWPMPAVGTSYTFRICRNAGVGCNLVDAALAATTPQINIIVAERTAVDAAAALICNPAPPGNIPVCIVADVNYTPAP